MWFFVDTTDVDEIREAAELGLLDGVTTNPSLAAKTGPPHDEVIKEIIPFAASAASVDGIYKIQSET